MTTTANWFVNGESLVQVKGSSASDIANLSELGLAEGPIRIIPSFRHLDINLDAWGRAPAEVQFMLSEVQVSMTLIHFNRDVLSTCLEESMGGSLAEGTLTRAGSLLGNAGARFSQDNHYIGLNITSPVGQLPWRFYFAYLTGPPMEFPLGTEKSTIVLNWRAIPFTADPYNDGQGAEGYVLFDHILDT